MTGASTVVLGATAAEGIRGVDLSAGTTSNSSINAAADTTSVGLTLIGGKGKNTITGSKGGDVLVGNAQDDILTGGDGADRITTGDGRDTVKGGLGNDTIVMGAKFDGFDSISGGTDRRSSNSPAQTQMLVQPFWTRSPTSRPSFLVTPIPRSCLKDASVAKDSTFTAGFDTNLSVTKTLELDGSADTDGKLNITGGGGADTLRWWFR